MASKSEVVIYLTIIMEFGVSLLPQKRQNARQSFYNTGKGVAFFSCA